MEHFKPEMPRFNLKKLHFNLEMPLTKLGKRVQKPEKWQKTRDSPSP